MSKPPAFPQFAKLVGAVAVATSMTAVLHSGRAAAEVTRTDMLVAGRAIGFVEQFGPGDLPMAIVYSPQSAQSQQQANEIGALLGSQLRIGNIVLKPFLLRVDRLDEAKARLFFLTDGLGDKSAKVGAASRELKVPCITFDLAQVKNGQCAIGVRSQPRVDVFVNRKAADESGTKVSSIFRLMVTEY